MPLGRLQWCQHQGLHLGRHWCKRLHQCEVLGDLVADRRVTASAVVCLTTNEQILTIRDDIFGATSTVHALRSAVPHDQNPEDLRLQKTLPEAAHLLLAGD